MRFEDWPQRLDIVVSEAAARSFAYGQFDCALFAADCVQAITGVDYAEQLRGYTSKVAAYRIVKEYGSLEAMATALLDREPKHPAMAKRGDIVLATLELAPGEQGEALGVCLGTRFCCPQETGLRFFNRSDCRLAWSIE